MNQDNQSDSESECRVLFITGIVSPFWLEFAQAVNQIPGVTFSIAFTTSSRGDRGKHWQGSSLNLRDHFVFDGDDLSTWLSDICDTKLPTVIIAGGIKGRAAKLGYAIAKERALKFGVFAEQPNVKNGVLNIINHVLYRWLFTLRTPDFLLAAGDRAVDLYRKLLPKSCHVTFFPYYQKIEIKTNNKEDNASDQIKFLFSGRLIARNSIKEMVDAFERLSHERTDKFIWCVSAQGPEEKWINSAMSRSNKFASHIYFDRDFAEWNDRLRPFYNSDILLVPAKHSGWGLVVPEGLAAGLAVISTRYVEAARYYVEDMFNGMFVEPTSDSIYESLVFCVDNPDIVIKLRKSANSSSMKGDVTFGADRFVMLLKKWKIAC